jgi:hypothetical protein
LLRQEKSGNPGSNRFDFCDLVSLFFPSKQKDFFGQLNSAWLAQRKKKEKKQSERKVLQMDCCSINFKAIVLSRLFGSATGLPDFFGTTHQNGENIPNNHKLYQMGIKFTFEPKIRQNGQK